MSAREMFEKLGYKQDKQKNYIVYWRPLKFGREQQIEFDFRHKTIEMRKEPDMRCEKIILKELQAINQQVKELGWLDE